MAGWLKAFRLIPWAEVISAAPAVARGARRLWDNRHDVPVGSDDAERVQALEAEAAAVRQDLTAASEAIAALGDEQRRLAEAVAVLHARVRLLTVACAVLLVLCGFAIWLAVRA